MRIDTQDTETTTGENMKIQMGRRQGKAIALGLLVLALVVGACGGGGDEEATPQAAADKADSTETAEAEATEQKKTEEAEEAAEAAEAEEEAEAEAVVVKKTCYVAPNADCSEVDMSGENLAGMILPGIYFAGANL